MIYLIFIEADCIPSPTTCILPMPIAFTGNNEKFEIREK